ncbi:MAG: LysR family transcriptional regulator [Rhodospirillaceae bacterium]|nr:LysR family transcriptional regulator [Rhodospirillaceae bacterium]
MRLPDLRALAAFVAIAERRSFAKAAKELGLSRSALSETLRGLETQLGVRLVNRTTRSVAPTEAGDRLLARLRPLLDDYRDALQSIGDFRDKPAGTLRLTVAPPAARSVLGPVLGAFLAQHPGIDLEVSVDGALVDIVAARFDAGIRPGERVERDMIAVRLTPEIRPLVVAAPAYLARRGAPATPHELQRHDCIRIRLPNGGFLPWGFERGGKRLEVAVKGSLIVNEPDLALRAAEDGAGLVQVAQDDAREPVADGRLVAVLEGWTPRSTGFYLYHPSRRQVPPPLQALIAFFRKTLPRETAARRNP